MGLCGNFTATAMSCTEKNIKIEILGFSSEQVEEYVTKFAEEDKEAGDTERRHISSNINILSLCYIPASCFIICSSLFKMVKFYGSKSLDLPTSLTNIYKKAVKIFYLRHKEEFRYKHSTREDFESSDLPPKERKKRRKQHQSGFCPQVFYGILVRCPVSENVCTAKSLSDSGTTDDQNFFCFRY